MTIADELRGLSETIVEVAIEFASSSLTAAELGGSLCGLSARAANLATRCEGLVSLEDALAAFRLTMIDHNGEDLNTFNGGVMEVEFVDRLKGGS